MSASNRPDAPSARRARSPAAVRSASRRPRWNAVEETLLHELVTSLQRDDASRPVDWKCIAQQLGGARSAVAVQQHWRSLRCRSVALSPAVLSPRPSPQPHSTPKSTTAMPAAGRFLFSPTHDAVGFVLPLLLALALTPAYWLVPSDHVPFWAYLILVVFTDVAHVWASAFRTFLDVRELTRRKSLLVALPFGAFAVGFTVHEGLSPRIFWSCLAYYAIYHFCKQDLGLLMLYIARGGVRPSKSDIQWDKCALYVGVVCPLLLWHADAEGRFSWFNVTERFAFTTPPQVLPLVRAVYVAVPVLYFARELSHWRCGRALNYGKLFVMAATYLTWALGTLLDHQLLGLAWLNLFHAFPSILLVQIYCRNRWATLEPLGAVDRFTSAVTSHWPLYLLALFAAACVEELLWDLFVWQQHLPRILWPAWWAHAAEEEKAIELSPRALSVAVAALSTPQIVHYFLDARIWRFDGSNPGLREYLLGPRP